MNIKTLIGTILLTQIFIFGGHSQEFSVESEILSNQTIDTNNWVKCPIMVFDDEEEDEEGRTLAEQIEISFPVKPVNFVLLDEFYVAKDEEGMHYFFGYQSRPQTTDWSLREFAEEVIKANSEQSNCKLLSFSFPEPSDSCFFAQWIENDKLVSVTFITSKYFIYGLETNVSDEVYKNINSIEIPEKVLKDLSKTGAYFKSFKPGILS